MFSWVLILLKNFISYIVFFKMLTSQGTMLLNKVNVRGTLSP